ncbi:MAG: hypothetical protein LJE90_15570 [Betaproteobacteria bacterium]|jgi:hypothetical protein|nr:hypothetical protein [Betaproteobacteria bacterium]
MRTLLAALLFALASPAFAAGPPQFQVRDTADYVALCSMPQSDENYTSAIAFCHGFGVGAYHYYHQSTPQSDRFVCPPNPAPKRGEVIAGFVAWAKTHPEIMKQPAVDSIFRYLGGMWPCKQ